VPRRAAPLCEREEDPEKQEEASGERMAAEGQGRVENQQPPPPPPPPQQQQQQGQVSAERASRDEKQEFALQGQRAAGLWLAILGNLAASNGQRVRVNFRRWRELAAVCRSLSLSLSLSLSPYSQWNADGSWPLSTLMAGSLLAEDSLKVLFLTTLYL
jgi:hypothetical protein